MYIHDYIYIYNMSIYIYVYVYIFIHIDTSLRSQSWLLQRACFFIIQVPDLWPHHALNTNRQPLNLTGNRAPLHL